jgi:hypothetical protein
VSLNVYVEVAVHGSRAPPRTPCSVTVHVDSAAGFVELGRESKQNRA